MAMNPLYLLKFKERLGIFQEQHPNFRAFLHEVHVQALEPGTILEITATSPQGKKLVTNLRLTNEDLETIKMAQTLRGER